MSRIPETRSAMMARVARVTVRSLNHTTFMVNWRYSFFSRNLR